MSTLRAAAFLCWLLVLFGLTVVWDALSVEPGGLVPHTATMVFGGKALAAVALAAAVVLHTLEFFGRRSRAKVDE